ncbi:IS66 family transposase [Terrimonas ferruginea]|uniref:IS66 family transposase n=1 Tax=Terrimonas ferruginea TaxID=249 RepID=UPI0008FFC0F7
MFLSTTITSIVLSAYAIDGRLTVDNNLVENSIRPVALGRKNYLFAGSHEAAKRHVVFFNPAPVRCTV